MIPRAATVCLLVAVLLACPLPCLSRAAASVRGCGGHSQGQDACCQDACCPRPESGEDRPCERDSRSGSGMCLCHGAVMDRPTTPPSPDGGLVSVLPLDAMLCAGESFFVEDRILTGRAACHFPAAESGREVRALIESLLL